MYLHVLGLYIILLQWTEQQSFPKLHCSEQNVKRAHRDTFSAQNFVYCSFLSGHPSCSPLAKSWPRSWCRTGGKYKQYIDIHTYTYTCIYFHIHAYTCIYMHMHTIDTHWTPKSITWNLSPNTQVNHMQIPTYTNNTYIYIHIHTYTFIYMHIYPYTCIYIQ